MFFFTDKGRKVDRETTHRDCKVLFRETVQAQPELRYKYDFLIYFSTGHMQNSGYCADTT